IDFTPFYAESGGQTGDMGYIFAGENRFQVDDTQKIKAKVFSQFGEMVSGSLKVGDAVTAQVDSALREASMRNHSATHLMHRALREVLGTHVEQKGSLVNAERTRFDFSHTQPVTSAQLAEVERRVNQAIVANVPVCAQNMSFDDAIAAGAMALFGEKYGDEVRVLSMGEFSTELCGGTHVARTGDIGLFKIVSESGIAAGVRRIEAVTGLNALQYVQQQEDLLKAAVVEVKAQTAEDLVPKLQSMHSQMKQLEKALSEARTELAKHACSALLAQAQAVGTARLILNQIDADSSALRDIAADLVSQGENIVVVLAAVNDGKIAVTAGISKALSKTVKAGELVNYVAAQVGG
ncbi:MAG: alanine--tRNA ligase-related protein, partial [Snodgrassella alvi]|nr:alanine--tRNA ligase-related protein [Snodgrassella alvi]